MLGLGVGGHWQMMKRNAVALGGLGEIRVVRHDRWNVDVEQPVTPAIEKVNKAVVKLRHHDEYPWPLFHASDTESKRLSMTGCGELGLYGCCHL